MKEPTREQVFTAVCNAIKDDIAAVVRAKLKTTGEEVNLICSFRPTGHGKIAVFPLAVLVEAANCDNFEYKVNDMVRAAEEVKHAQLGHFISEVLGSIDQELGKRLQEEMSERN